MKDSKAREDIEQLRSELSSLRWRVKELEEHNKKLREKALLKEKKWIPREVVETAYGGSYTAVYWYPPAKSCLKQTGYTREEAAKLAAQTK